MRLTIACLCLVSLACAGSGPSAPTSPAVAAGAPVGPQAQSAAPRPFRGTFTLVTRGVQEFPELHVTGTTEGTATLLGRFTASTVETIDIPTAAGRGTHVFTAANGDQLTASIVGEEVGFTPPNISHIREVATVVAGTGRFAGASGTFVIVFSQAIDFASGTSTGAGSFDGEISLRN